MPVQPGRYFFNAYSCMLESFSVEEVDASLRTETFRSSGAVDLVVVVFRERVFSDGLCEYVLLCD